MAKSQFNLTISLHALHSVLYLAGNIHNQHVSMNLIKRTSALFVPHIHSFSVGAIEAESVRTTRRMNETKTSWSLPILRGLRGRVTSLSGPRNVII